MKAKFNSAWIAVKAFVKKNAFSCACFLLAAAIFVTGSVSYAKYVTNSSVGGGASAGSFSVDATIDGVSALSFTNTEFWGTSASGEPVPMNALRSVNFSVRNYTATESGEEIVASTRLKYNLAFSAPTNFAEKLALQVFDQGGAAMMPQIVIADLISAADNKTTYDTAKSTKYNATDYANVIFSVSKTDTGYVATAKGITVRLEQYKKEVEQSLMFRLWDTSSVTNATTPSLSSEGGKLQAPLTVTYTENVDYYRIIITLDAFVLPAGTATEVKHSVRLAPVDSLVDNYVGSTFVENNGSHTPITSIYGGTDETWYLQSVWENVTDTFDSGKTETSSNNVSNVIGYEVGKTYTSSTSTNTQVNESTDNYGNYTVTTTQTTDSGWTAWTVTDEPTRDNFENDMKEGTTKSDYFKSIVVKVLSSGQTDYHTGFALYELPASHTKTETITTTEVVKKVGARNVTDRAITEEDQKTVETVVQSDGTETITMKIVRTTTTTELGSEYVESTTTTTTTVTRNYTQTGTMYRAYYVISDSDTFTFFNNDAGFVTGVADSSVGGGGYRKATTADNVGEIKEYETKGEPNSTNDEEYTESTSTSAPQVTKVGATQTFSSSKEKTENITRQIVRTYVYTPIQLSNVVWQKEGADGTLENVTYTAESPFNFYTDGIQKYYLAQCYSKEYPFFVDVVFEQVLE